MVKTFYPIQTSFSILGYFSQSTTFDYNSSVAAANLNWVTVKVYCGSYEVTSSNVPGLSVSNGVVTIPAAMPEDSYKLYVSGIYTCPNGCQKAFSGDFPFTVE